MDIEYVTKLIELVSESKVDEIEIEEDGKKIRVAKTHQSAAAPTQTVYQVAPPQNSLSQTPVMPAAPVSQALASALPAEQPAPAATAGPKYHEVKSPIVGTFYRSPAPEAPAFVQVGGTVQKGSVLCIVEAMKLMNEIESDVAGKIVQIMVENGQPVEYDQVLFLIEPA
ncbi:MAG: acetyl-CoA carboxylase biotin carboxyl carrier protein [Bacteroidetes bacterium]|nr:acetyl-CoA carboxylase biotin carboxyl carrier protein [Bacteroidota bacterium]MCW5895983.1 acetyl-CoA carboxylase biotin carboxyl carrier protein [Bacteroidota bacterium]